MSTKSYILGSRRVLHDLNGNLKNFDVTFTITAQDPTATFEVLVVDQKTLDSAKPLNYRKAAGSISGNIVADKDLFQNYFLILRSQEPCPVNVKTVIKEISPKIAQNIVPAAPPAKSKSSKQKEFSNLSWHYYVLGIIFIASIIAVIYYYTVTKKNNDKKI